VIPRISVVMPTHNRAKLLPATLRALGAQTVPATQYELILVADGCTDDTPQTVESVRAELPYTLHFIEQAPQGAAITRNRGVAEASAPLILFLDDDMEAAPGLIEAHLAEHAVAPGSLVLGYFPIPFGPSQRDPFARSARHWWDAGFAARRDPGYRFGFRDFCTGNISLSTELFRAVGGFYQRIGHAAGEDYELGYRLLKTGAKFRFAPLALSLHRDVNTLERALRRARAEGEAHAHIVQRHNELAWCFNLYRLSRLQRFPFTPLWRLVWRNPAIADFGARILKTAVVAARRLGFESVMWRLFLILSGHAYWRGVHAGLGSLSAWERLMQDAPLEPEDAAEIDLDLACELADLENRLEHQTDSIRVWWKGAPLGRIRPIPGAERLSAAHVRDEAIQNFARSLLDHVTVPANWQPRERRRKSFQADSSVPARFGRAKVAQFDLCAPDHLWGLESFETVQLLVKNAGRPLANIRLPLVRGTAVLTGEELAENLERGGLRRDDSIGLVQTPSLLPVSVVVCTRDRPHALRRCLRALTKLEHPNYEVVVVDNASLGTETAEIVAATPFRYVREDRPGLDWARNRGIAESRNQIIAYVDDDAVVDPNWLAAIAVAFDDQSVAVVTGLVLAAELTCPAQHVFELYGGMGKGMNRRDLDGSRMTADDLVAAHAAGVGANMAFRRQTFDRVGTFDTALDVGTLSNGGGDLDIFHRVLVAGLTIRYEPAAFMWHYHRRELPHLRKQLYNNGRAFGVYLLKILRTRTVARSSVLRYALVNWLGGWLLTRLLKTATKKERFPVQLVLAELWGATHALWAYGATYRADRIRRTLPTVPPGSHV